MKFSGTFHDTIESGYNYTRKADPYICNRLVHYLMPAKKEFYVDIECGSGNYAMDLNDKGIKFCGIDPSDKKLQEAKFKSQKINWLQGSAESIPVENKFFSGAIATLTVQQWLDFPASFSEINRVLKMKSRFIIFTALPEQMEKYWLHHYFPGMMQRSIKQMPTLGLIGQAMHHTGFKLIGSEKYFIQENLRDLFLYSGKNNPALYLDEQFRNGISTFTSLSDPVELRDGLKKLALDLANARFSKVRERYDDSAGDYIFLILEKNG